MPRKNTRNTKGRIISAAWKLFYEQGYEDTTIEDIVFESETSKGSFYHYFDGKDALLGTLSNVFDEKYEELLPALSPEQDAIEKLVFLNHELFAMIDGGISLDLLARLLSTQLLTRGEKHLLDRNRGAAPGGPDGERDRKGLRPLGAGAAVRLVPLRRGVLAGGLHGRHDAHISGELAELIEIFAFRRNFSLKTVRLKRLDISPFYANDTERSADCILYFVLSFILVKSVL